MGFLLYEESGTFDPTVHGLKVGDTIFVVAVGGGSSGSCDSVNAGTASSFGSFVTAPGGSDKDGQCVAFGNGGCGGFYPGEPRLSAPPLKTGTIRNGAVVMYNGAGVTWSGAVYSNETYSETYVISGLGGGFAGHTDQGSISYEVKAGDGNFNGIGAKGARATPASSNYSENSLGGGGAGYGASGGSVGDVKDEIRSYTHLSASGYIKKAMIKLDSLDSIAVTVGQGGAETSAGPFRGGAGAPGCVCVCW